MRIVTFLMAGSLAVAGLVVTAAAVPSRADELPSSGGAHTVVVPPGPEGLTPEERMNRRFPQPVRTADLIGLPVLDFGDRTLGRVRDVVRTPEGKIVLVVPIGGWLGWRARPVGIPIETVAILARQLDLLDIKREQLSELPTWSGSGAMPVDRDEMIRVALGRR